jgi:hypothetical protein
VIAPFGAHRSFTEKILMALHAISARASGAFRAKRHLPFLRVHTVELRVRPAYFADQDRLAFPIAEAPVADGTV